MRLRTGAPETGMEFAEETGLVETTYKSLIDIL